MPSDEEKGGSKEREEKRKEKKRKVGVATRRTAFFTCVRPFSLEDNCDIYISCYKINNRLLYIYILFIINKTLLKSHFDECVNNTFYIKFLTKEKNYHFYYLLN